MSEPYEPLSDSEFVRVMHDAIVNRDGETIEELADDARYHRARVRELQRQVEAARSALAEMADPLPFRDDQVLRWMAAEALAVLAPQAGEVGS